MKDLRTKSITLLISLFAILYGSLFLLTFLSPYTIETQAKSFIVQKVSERTHEQIEKIGSNKNLKNRLTILAQKKMQKEKKSLLLFKKLLHDKADEKLAFVIAKVSNKDCECRKKHQKFFHDFLTHGVTSLSKGIKNIENFMTQSYMVIMQKVLTDFKIFLGINFFTLLLLLLLLHYNQARLKILEVLSGLMLVSSLIASYFYIFSQNWFFTLIFNDYVGFWYLLYVGLIFAFLVDITLNKGGVTDALVSSVSSSSIC